MITTILYSNTPLSKQRRTSGLHASPIYLPSIPPRLRKVLWFSVLFALLCDSCLAMSDDHERAKKLLDHGIVQPLESILNLYAEQYPGPVLDIKMETKNKLIFYKIDIADNDGIVQTLTVNAQSGHLLLAKKKSFKRATTATN